MMNNKCLVCKKEIPDNCPSLRLKSGNGSMCMRCEEAEIDVYKITLPGEKYGYLEREVNGVAEVLEGLDCDEGFTVIKKKILAVEYYSKPEFTGF